MSRKPIPHKELLKDPEYAAIYVEELEEQYQFLLRHLSQAQSEIQAMERVVEDAKVTCEIYWNEGVFLRAQIRKLEATLAELDKVREGKK